MASQPRDLRDELMAGRLKFGIYHKVDCTPGEIKEFRRLQKAGQRLPEGVHRYTAGEGFMRSSDNSHYRISIRDFGDSDLFEYLAYMHLSTLRTIKNILMFFATLVAIGLLVWFIILIFAL